MQEEFCFPIFQIQISAWNYSVLFSIFIIFVD